MAFRFLPSEIAEMERHLASISYQPPQRNEVEMFAESFSKGPERMEQNIKIQAKQVWNWFQNRRHQLRVRQQQLQQQKELQQQQLQQQQQSPLLLQHQHQHHPQQLPQAQVLLPLQQRPEQYLLRQPQQQPQEQQFHQIQKQKNLAHVGTAAQGVANMPMPSSAALLLPPPPPPPASAAPPPPAPPTPPPPPAAVAEFEAKSSRDGAWYDVDKFISHRMGEKGEPEVLVRFAGFGPDEDEWVTAAANVRVRSLPCEAMECIAVLPGDLVLCFQEANEQALYYDAEVLEVQRRRHDMRGCRCRFWVRYYHDHTEEIVPIRKICRRPETDYRLQAVQQAVQLLRGNSGGGKLTLPQPLQPPPPVAATPLAGAPKT